MQRTMKEIILRLGNYSLFSEDSAEWKAYRLTQELCEEKP